MSNHGKTRRRVIEQLRYTMSDFTKWKIKDVQTWLADIAKGSKVLEKELARNQDAFRMANGRELLKMDDRYLASMEVSFNSRSILIECIQDLKDNEEKNIPRRKKAAKLEDAFRNSDEDQSGTIEQDEIRDIVRKTFPGTSDTILKVYYEVLLRECDKNNTGCIQLDEFLSGDQKTIMMKIMAEAEQAEIIEANFNLMDKDGSGELDPDELRELIDQSFSDCGPTKRGQYYNLIKKELDANNDGTIALEEFIASEYLSLLRQEPQSRLNKRDMRCCQTSPKRLGSAEISLAMSGEKMNLGLETACLEGQPASVLMDKAEDVLDNNINGWDDADELFILAGQKFAEEGDHSKAALAFQRASDCYIKLSQDIEAARALTCAADQFHYCGIWDEVIDCWREVAEIYLAQMRPRMAAKYYFQVADLYKVEMDDPASAIDWYLEASKLYSIPDDIRKYLQCLQATLPLYAKLEMWEDASNMARLIGKIVEEDNQREPVVLPVAGMGTTMAGNLATLGRNLQWDMAMTCVLLDLANLDTVSEKVRAKGIQQVEETYQNYVRCCPVQNPLMVSLLKAVKAENVEILSLTIAQQTEHKDFDAWIRSLFDIIVKNVNTWCANQLEKKKAEEAERQRQQQEAEQPQIRRKISRANLHPSQSKGQLK
eukprot:TRINITY_DN67378_c1_g1_i1.p1 TRINITY_DN67378_c1_g1~~TRINITY_DN67378_c1_g1_i1.p1  ORF type:complete len:656 (-),score=61.21 TRINITY_DN67378_c1_g1_i1:1196-3163(-)